MVAPVAAMDTLEDVVRSEGDPPRIGAAR